MVVDALVKVGEKVGGKVDEKLVGSTVDPLAFFSALIPFAVEETVEDVLVEEDVGKKVGGKVDEKLVGTMVDEPVGDAVVVNWVGAVVDTPIRDALGPASLDNGKDGPMGRGVGIKGLPPKETDEALSGPFFASLDTGKDGPMGRGVGLRAPPPKDVGEASSIRFGELSKSTTNGAKKRCSCNRSLVKEARE